jgi:ribonuclease HII
MELGVDEVGRGPLFGRVYAASVILPKRGNFDHSILKDSKLFSQKSDTIINVSNYIKKNALSWNISYKDENVIDKINILQATQETMHLSIHNTIKKYNDKNTNTDGSDHIKYKLLIDGNYFIPFNYINSKNCFEQVDFECVVKGDNTYTSIAAASILAKVARDEYIYEMCKQYPLLDTYYNLSSNKGYGSKTHRDGITKYGITIFHRKTFGICKISKINNIGTIVNQHGIL